MFVSCSWEPTCVVIGSSKLAAILRKRILPSGGPIFALSAQLTNGVESHVGKSYGNLPASIEIRVPQQLLLQEERPLASLGVRGNGGF